MTSRPVSRARALRRAFSRQWARVRKNPRLLPGFASKAWRVVRWGQLDKLIERDRMRTDWFSDYMAWASEHDNKTLLHLALLSEKVAALPRPPRFGLVIVDDSAGDAASRAAAKAALDAQVHPAHVRDTVPDEAAALTAMESLAARGDVDYVGIFGSGDTFAPDALAELALELAASPSTALVYVDHDVLMSDGSRAHPDFKPSWDPYLFAQQPYLVRSAFARRDVVAKALSGKQPLSEWDLLWQVAEAAGPTAIAHLPRVLIHRAPTTRSEALLAHPPHLHFERRGVSPRYEPLAPETWRLRLPLPATPPRVTVIIPTRDHPDLLAAAVDGVLDAHGVSRPGAHHRRQRQQDAGGQGAPRRAASRCRACACSTTTLRSTSHASTMRQRRLATGSVLCFLNDDTNVIAPDWLDEMTALALHADVGVVGARLIYGDGTIQHAGVLLGAFALTHHLLRGRPADFRGYHNRGLLTHAVSAVTAACAVVRRELFDTLGGFDEQLARRLQRHRPLPRRQLRAATTT